MSESWAGQDLVHIRGLTTLQHLDLQECTRSTCQGLQHLSSLIAMQHLNLFECSNLTDPDLEQLSGMTDLGKCDDRPGPGAPQWPVSSAGPQPIPM
jgi:hypothetical protein